MAPILDKRLADEEEDEDEDELEEEGDEGLDLCMDSEEIDEALDMRQRLKDAEIEEPSMSREQGIEGLEPGKKKEKKVLSAEDMKRLNDKAERRGVVYISRIPPHMKPAKIRQLLSPFGELGRLYCAPEDPSLRRERKKKGKDTGKNFTEGWVEFEDKAVAKQVAARLNGQPIGGKKRSAYYFDLWCLKYLSKFKWDNLTEEINYQRAMREQKLAVEIAASKRERDFYLSKVDKAKGIQSIKKRKREKEEKETGAGAGAGAGAMPSKVEGQGERGRQFKQRRVKADAADSLAPSMPSDVLRMI